MARQPRSKLPLEDLQNLFAFAQSPQEHRYRANIQRMSGQPEQMRSYPVQLRKNGADVMRARWHGQSHHLLNGFYPDQTVGDRGNVIQTVPVRGDHGVHPVLGDLFHPSMEKTNVAINVDYGFAVELEDDAQHTVSRRMLWPHVERHLGAIEQRLFGCCDFYLMHIVRNL